MYHIAGSYTTRSHDFHHYAQGPYGSAYSVLFVIVSPTPCAIGGDRRTVAIVRQWETSWRELLCKLWHRINTHDV